MSQSIKQIKNRIRSVENTKKVTGAMQMISVAKLNRIQDQLLALRPYALRLEDFMYNLAGLARDSSGYFRKSPLQADIALCVITSDSGLCGMYNQNIIRVVQEFLEKNNPERVKLAFNAAINKFDQIRKGVVDFVGNIATKGLNLIKDTAKTFRDEVEYLGRQMVEKLMVGCGLSGGFSLAEAGANILISASYIFEGSNPQGAYQELVSL